MKPIPFSPPRIDQKTIDAVTEVLLSGWITTGPKTRELEKRINEYCESKRTLCLNAWTNAVELVLRWYGVGPVLYPHLKLPTNRRMEIPVFVVSI